MGVSGVLHIIVVACGMSQAALCTQPLAWKMDQAFGLLQGPGVTRFYLGCFEIITISSAYSKSSYHSHTSNTDSK